MKIPNYIWDYSKVNILYDFLQNTKYFVCKTTKNNAINKKIINVSEKAKSLIIKNTLNNNFYFQNYYIENKD